mgnify:CR=1 FL=1
MLKKIKQPKASIIIVNYNGEKFLPKLLNSLKKTKYLNYEIIVVDNISTDNSVKIITKYSELELQDFMPSLHPPAKPLLILFSIIFTLGKFFLIILKYYYLQYYLHFFTAQEQYSY